MYILHIKKGEKGQKRQKKKAEYSQSCETRPDQKVEKEKHTQQP
jgi:hypothetical protein